MPLSAMEAIAGRHETLVVYLVLQLQAYERRRLVEVGLSGISFSPGGVEAF